MDIGRWSMIEIPRYDWFRYDMSLVLVYPRGGMIAQLAFRKLETIEQFLEFQDAFATVREFVYYMRIDAYTSMKEILSKLWLIRLFDRNSIGIYSMV